MPLAGKLVKPIIVRYLDAAGRQVPKGTPGARQVREVAKKWYAVGVPGWPPGKRVPLARHKKTAEAFLDRLVKKAFAEKHGTATPAEKYQEHNARPLAEHLDAYRRELASRGPSAKHVSQTCDRIKALIDGCGFRTIPDMESESVVEWLAELQRDKAPAELPAGVDGFRPGDVAAMLAVSYQALNKMAKRAGVRPTGKGRASRYPRAAVELLLRRAARGASVQTAHFYLSAFKGFCRWLVEDDRMAKNPIRRLRVGDPELDRRHNRRELPVEDLLRLMEATRTSGTTFRGLTAADRHAIYLTAAGTGFRAGELASLRPESFDFSDDVAKVTIPAKAAKNRKRATLPLQADVAATLRLYLRGRPTGSPVWPGTWAKAAADMLRIDLQAAGVPYEVHGPDGAEYADFHSLRHSFITLLARSGVAPKEAQQLARHSDIRLTLDRYTHTEAAALAASVARLPALVGTVPVVGAEPVSLSAEEYAGLVSLAAAGLILSGFSCTKVAQATATDGDESGQSGTAAA
jgi:integrase